MAVRTIYSEWSFVYWVDAAVRLAVEKDWQPCYWIAHLAAEGRIRKHFPNVVLHSTFDAIRGIRPPECAHLPSAPVDEALLGEFAKEEKIFLKMLDRMDPGQGWFSHEERVRLYRSLLGYWSAVLDHFSPDLVAFPVSPHIGYDYILYVLCKKKGVQTVMFVTTIEDLVYPVERFEEGSPRLQATYEELVSQSATAKVELSPKLEDYLKRISGVYSPGTHFYMKRFLEDEESPILDEALFKRLTDFRRYPQYFSKLYQFLSCPAPLNYLKQKGRKFDGHISRYWQFIWWCKVKAFRKKRQLKTSYNRLARAVDLSVPYVLVALHYQPERTTSPDGGFFVDQGLMVDLLSKSVPKGWLVYVKEHVSQFSHSGVGERSRTKDFYDDLVSLPNVRLLPLNMPSYDLIDRCKAVATITGTIGWEAVVRGKACLVFGHAWYRGCEGVFYTTTYDACRKVFSKIQAGYKVNPEKVRIFMAALEQTCFSGYVESGFDEAPGVSLEKNVPAVAKALWSFYESLKSREKSFAVVE